MSIPGGQTQIELGVDDRSTFDAQAVTSWPVSPATAIDLDYQKTQIFDFTGLPMFDLASQSTTWSVGTIGNAPSLTFTDLMIDRDTGSSGIGWEWQLYGPPSFDGSAALPTLPTDVFTFNPEPGDHVSVENVIAEIVPGGYDAVRGVVVNRPGFPGGSNR